MRPLTPAAIALACAALAVPALAQTPPSATLPTPYSAEQIREAWQPGFRVEMRTTQAGAESRSRMTVISATPESAVIRSEEIAASGAASAPPAEVTATFSQLRDHALFDATKASRERAECRSQLGSMPGWRYVTTDPSGAVLTMCFADATPGPPVEYQTTRDGAVVSRTEHVRYGELPSSAEEES
jgi:hypothetical protein